MKYLFCFLMTFLLFDLNATPHTPFYNIIKKNQVIYDYYMEQCGNLMISATQNAIKKLNMEKKNLIDNDKLESASIVKKIILKISNSQKIKNSDFQLLPQKIKIICNTYIHRMEKVENLYSKSEKNLKNKILNEVKSNNQISKSTIESLQAIFDSGKLDYLELDHLTENENSNISKSPNKQDHASIQNDDSDIIFNSAFVLANNLLASNINSEKGQILFLFLEKIQPQNKKILNLRKKAERKNYIPVLPPILNENPFLATLEKYCSNLLQSKTIKNPAINYCALLLYMKPDSNLKNKINQKFDSPDPFSVLNFMDNIFGGTEEVEELRMQLINADKANMENILRQIQTLKRNYPKNKDVDSLFNELNKNQENKINQTEKIKHAPEIKLNNKALKKYITCTKCNGSKKIICPQCIGSGTTVEKEICTKCNGTGKNWLGLKCNNCNGTGFTKHKTKCLNCNGTGKVLCPKCNGTGKIPAI